MCQKYNNYNDDFQKFSPEIKQVYYNLYYQQQLKIIKKNSP
jgi:hypothetical protein